VKGNEAERDETESNDKKLGDPVGLKGPEEDEDEDEDKDNSDGSSTGGGDEEGEWLNFGLL